MTELPDDGFMVGWNIERRSTPLFPGPALEVGPHPDITEWSVRYMSTTGCCDAYFMHLSRAEKAQALLNLAADLMFDGILPADVLHEFAKVSLWRDMQVTLPSGRYGRAFIPGSADWMPHTPPD